MIELYKILSGKYDPDVSDFIKLNESNYDTRGHQYKVKKEAAKLNIRKQSFSFRTTDLWNSLPPHIVNAKSILNFEIQLDRHWDNKDFKYNPDAEKPTQRDNLHADLPPEAQACQAEEDL